MKFFAALAAALFCSCVLGQGPRTIPVAVGGAQIVLVAPKGYFRVTPGAPELVALGEEFTPKSNRLLGHFVKASVLQHKARGSQVVFDRYFLAQVARDGESLTYTGGTFVRVRRMLATQHANSVKAVAPRLAELEKSGATSKGGDGILAGLKVGEIIPAGVYQDNDDSFIYGAFNRLQYKEGESKAQTRVMLVVTSVVLLKQKVLILHAYTPFGGAADLQWAKAAALSWVSELTALNK